MDRLRTSDAEIAYRTLGSGPPVVLLHPFPACHEFWLPVADVLGSRYQLVLPDLRAHGESDAGEGPATMQKHAADLIRLCDVLNLGRSVFVGTSIGGYVLFELLRQSRERVAALILTNTKATPDTPEARANRLKAADDVMERGTAPFLDGMVPKLLGETTQRTRPDLVASARQMMNKMSPEDIRAVQLGMAERPDSVPTLKIISVPMLVIGGSQDVLTPVAEAEVIRQNVSNAELRVIGQAGHYAPFEKSSEVAGILRQFLNGMRW